MGYNLMQMERSHLLDNAKYMLIFFVVFGHTLEPIFKLNPISNTLWLAIFSFHMPAFIMVTGMLSKSHLDKEQCYKIFKSIIIPFLVFSVFYEAFFFGLNGEISSYIRKLAPNWIMWFLLSLACFKVLLPLFLKLKHPIIISIIISLIAGYIDKIGYPLGLSRTIYFFPFFLIGYKYKTDLFINKKLAISIIILTVASFAYFGYIEPRMVYGSFPYEHDHYLIAPIKRIIMYTVSFLMVVSFLSLIPNKEFRFTEKGKNSLYVYLWHGFFIKIMVWMGVIAFIGSYNVVISISVLFILSLIITSLLSSHYISFYTSKMLFNPLNKIALKYI